MNTSLKTRRKPSMKMRIGVALRAALMTASGMAVVSAPSASAATTRHCSVFGAWYTSFTMAPNSTSSVKFRVSSVVPGVKFRNNSNSTIRVSVSPSTSGHYCQSPVTIYRSYW